MLLQKNKYKLIQFLLILNILNIKHFVTMREWTKCLKFFIIISWSNMTFRAVTVFAWYESFAICTYEIVMHRPVVEQTIFEFLELDL